MKNNKNWLEVDDLLHGGVYLLNARNLQLGLYDNRIKGFYGIRRIFGNKLIDIEYHWDTGKDGDPHTGTAKPVKLLNHSFNIMDKNPSSLVDSDELMIFLSIAQKFSELDGSLK
jgi:hypothetical protein